MQLKRLELQGFKTFAQKTSLDFAGASQGRHMLTVIVGPNGSGKSNLSDAIRWCLGEQSLKLLRGKKAEDIIFSGSEGKSRSGFAEVSLTFDNSDKSMKIDFAEVTITRRLYRNGESEYLLNGQSVRLSDIQMLLAEAGVGQRSYSVIGQGMIDHVLTSTPEERKIFFDDAMGVRGFQMKRHQAMLKLQKSAENLSEAEMLLGELEPRVLMLKRQVERLQKREAVETELHGLQTEYFASQWWTLAREREVMTVRLEAARAKVVAKQAELRAGDARLLVLEKQQGTGTKDDGRLSVLQAAYKAAQQELAEARRVHFTVERELELSKVRAQTSWAPLPLLEIIAYVGEISAQHKTVLDRLKSAQDFSAMQAIVVDVEQVLQKSTKLKERLTRPNPEDFSPDPALLATMGEAKTKINLAEQKAKATEQEMDGFAREAATQKQEVFDFQRQLRAVQQEIFALEQQANAVAIEMTRVETRLEGLEREMRDELGEERAAALRKEAPVQFLSDVQATHERMVRLKHQLELIGGIDEDVSKEYEQTNERFAFLTTQVQDLRDAIRSTEKVIDELDEEIRVQSDKSFASINEQFKKYFKVLFGGGSCSLVKMSQDEVDKDETKLSLDRAMEEMAEETAEAIQDRVQDRREAVVGIDIQATPPGKKLKALNLLSGGERALTSIALVSAIMATNPSPFVVLDEVDAALDEANTMRFANILEELQKLTQFIVVTHNRATMEKADILYGVTMGDEGVSKLLSVKLEDIGEGGTARR